VPQGHAIQARVYAEDPARGFRPSSGLLTRVQLPSEVRVDSWIETGTEVSGYYDPLLAKIIAHGATREAAISRLSQALAGTAIHGIETNVPWLRTVLAHPAFAAGRPTTRLLDSHSPVLPGIEVLDPGTMSTIQDWPGRTGLWDVGIPPSGPMDAVALRLANRIVGNAEGIAAVEMTVTGATLLFNAPAVIALTGASMSARLDDTPVDFWQSVVVNAGSTLHLGPINGAGQRSYLAIQGGLDLPDYMGSRSTFTLGRFGGHGGRALRTGDVLRLTGAMPDLSRCAALPDSLRPAYGGHWQIGVIDGPHGAPDFFTQEDMAAFYAADWEVHYNSSRTGVRLIGPKPKWARLDGGEAGLHPSNIHDNAYAIGSIDYTGDMPVILGPDGPSLGGFVCPATVAIAELWKLGQLQSGDRVRFVSLTPDAARQRLLQQDRAISALDANAMLPPPAPRQSPRPQASPTVVLSLEEQGHRAAVCIRQAGEDNLLVEFGAPELDLALRFQVQALLESLQGRSIPGFQELTPGIRSLQVHFDARQLTQGQALDHVIEAISALPNVDTMRLPSRIVHLPLSWDDPATRLATERYMRSVRADAPWCPDNIEFIRRINGLDSIDTVRDIVFSASYLVMGLGDVYLGAPVATPLDPRHRLVTTKYNPARTWTPENAVGIGGAYLCVYGMEGPGGYQFVGRTVQMWNHHRQGADFRDGKQWLLRFFDQIRFHPVSAGELLRIRAGFVYGQHPLRMEETTLSLGEYRSFLSGNADSIAAFRATQREAFEAERGRWRAAGIVDAPQPEPAPLEAQNVLPVGCVAIRAPVTGSVWQVHAAAGQQVQAGDELLVMEAMKMEIGVKAQQGGRIEAVYCTTGKPAAAGDLLLALRPGAVTQS
jgi:urea carboxylase